MDLSGIVPKIKNLFTLENNIKAEGLLEAHREASFKQAKRLEAVAQSLLKKPSRSSIKTLAEEVFSIRSEILNSTLNLLIRLKPALTPEQFLACEQQLKESLSKTLQPAADISQENTQEDAHPELITLNSNDAAKSDSDEDPELLSNSLSESKTVQPKKADPAKNKVKPKPVLQTTG